MLSPDGILQQAQQLTGIHDKIKTPIFREALEVLVESLREDQSLTASGQAFAKAYITASVGKLLSIQKALDMHPTIKDVRLPRPIFVIGFPRSGTTLLHQLLSDDPTSLSFPFWQLLDPVPPVLIGSERADQRRLMAKAVSKMWPKLNEVHPLKPDGPEECRLLFENSLLTYSNFLVLPSCTRYLSWLARQDMSEAYQLYLNQMQIMLYRQNVTGKKDLVLKDPYNHPPNLKALFHIFPDAKIVYIHRDIKDVIRSCLKLWTAWNSPFLSGVEKLEGALAAFLNTIVARAKAPLRNLKAPQMAPVAYDDLTAHPIDTVVGIYRKLDLEVTDALATNLKDWLGQPGSKPPQSTISISEQSVERVYELLSQETKLFRP